MGAYEAPSAVQCRGPISLMISCEDIIEDMPATTNMEIFAPPQNSSATVLLPQAVESGKLLNQTPIYLGLPS